MERAQKRRQAILTATVFGVAPCLLGLGIAQYMRWSGTAWLSSSGAFWPTVCVAISCAFAVALAVSSTKDTTARFWGWLMLAWTWLYVPPWLWAKEIPQSSAVVPGDGRVYVAGAWARQPSDKVWLLTGRAGDRIVRNVAGTTTASDIDVQYRYSETYIARRSHDEDLATPLAGAVNAILAEEARKPRSSRIALFDKREVHEQLLGRICRAAAPGEAACPLKLTLAPRPEAMLPGAVWSKYHTEREAIDERHLPTLVQLLTQDNSRLVDRDGVFALFMDLANAPEDLSAVARKSSVLDASQFDALIRRIIASPACGNEAVAVLAVNRLSPEQRRELRAKAFREASLSLLANNAVALRITDAEVAQLAPRLRATSGLTPEVAVLVLEKFGERLPVEAQHDAVASIVAGNVAHAFAALRHVNFSPAWREKLVARVVTGASHDDFEAARLSREALEALLTPTEMRALIAAVVRRSEASAKWLSFAVQTLPVRAMTLHERKTLLNGLLFESTKSAMEFVSEYRQFLEVEDVREITYDYTKSIEPGLCLHLSHRNNNRKNDYFSEAQLQIFRDCARNK